MKAHYRMLLDAAAPLMPSAAEALARIDDERFYGLFGAALGEAMMWSAFRMHEETELTLAFFSGRTAGMNILARLLAAGGSGGPFPSDASLPVSISRVARDCGVSRPHVRKLITDAEAVGFFGRDDAGGLLATPLLAEHARLWMAIRFSFAELVARESLRRLG